MPIYYRNTPLSEPFTFDSIGNNWRQERLSRPNGYPLYHYLQTESGRGSIIIQGQSYILEAGEGVLIAPFVSHSYFGVTKEWVTLFATFTGTIESSIAKLTGNKTVILTDKNQGAVISAIICEAIKKYESSPTDVRALSIDCYSLLMSFIDGIYTNTPTENPLYQRYVEPIIKEIETNYSYELTVRKLSMEVYVTPQYLSRLFKRFLGCSVYEYLTAYRINKAKEFLLTHPHLKIQEIARKTGFIDTSHFIAVFKKATGFTPLEFRRLN